MVEYVGYYPYELRAEDRLDVSRASLTSGVTIYGLCEVGNALTFRIPVWQNGDFEKALKAKDIPYTKGKMGGICGSAKKYLTKPSVLIGLFLAITIYILLSGFIWEVRVYSATDIDEDDVLSRLCEAGLYEGVWRPRLDEDTIVASYLALDDSAAFVSIHLEGLIAYVELIPKKAEEQTMQEPPPSHLVASRDAVIEEIRMYEGVPAIRIGETVRAGQLLVSGVVTTKGGTRFVAADAEVMGRVEDTISITIPFRQSIGVVRERRQVGYAITLFGKTKSFGNLSGDYVERERLYLFGLVRLPIVVERSYQVTYETVEQEYSEQFVLELALLRLRTALLDTVGEGTLITKETAGEFTDEGYTITCRIIYETNIAKSLAFSVDNQ